MRKRFLGAILGICGSVSIAQAQPVPAGSELQVNSFTTCGQLDPAVAVDPNGNFVVVWTSYCQEGSESGVFARTFNSIGAQVSGDLQVNSFTTSYQDDPSVGMDSGGNFVVVWASDLQDGSIYGIFGRRFDLSGSPLGGEFPVNTYTTSSQRRPDVAVDPNGNFVVVWQSYDQDGSAEGIFGRRFTAGAAPAGVEFQVNTSTTGYQTRPEVASDPDGNFVVVWQSTFGDGSSYGVFARLFDSAGLPVAAEYQVNTFTTNQQYRPSVAMVASGEFLVVWASAGGQDGSGVGVFARQFDSSGAPLGAEFQVNAHTTGDQNEPDAAVDSSGNFVIVWQSFAQDGSSYGVFGRRFNALGTPVTGEFQVNTYTTGSQEEPTVALDAGGGFVVAWESYYQDGSYDGVFAQRFCTGDADADGACDGSDNCALIYNPGQGDQDADGPGDACDNCEFTYNPGQDDQDADGRGDACDVIITSPLDGGTLDCSDPRTVRPLFTWDRGEYDAFRVEVSWVSDFSVKLTSGKDLIRASSWTPGRKSVRRMCLKANPDLFIRIFAVDRSLPRRDPFRTTFSQVVIVDTAP